MKFFIETFGCQMNLADSEEMSRHLSARGFATTLTKEEADLILLNTCTVRQHAEDRALSYLGRLKNWKRKKPNRILILTGCAAERLKNSIQKRFPFIDLVVSAKSIEEFPKMVNALLDSRSPIKTFGDRLGGNVTYDDRMARPGSRNAKFDWFEESERSFENDKIRDSGEPLVLGEEEKTAFVTIMRGCNYSCSYCIVPFVRGREIYRPVGEILTEIREKIGEGKKEVMLLGQTVNSYWFRERITDPTPARVGAPLLHTPSASHPPLFLKGNEGNHPSPSRRPFPTPSVWDGAGRQEWNGEWKMTDFADLLKLVNQMEEVESIRFMSPHPHYMNEKLLQTLADCKKVSSQIHLPVQSGSNAILKAMKRNYTREQYLKIVQKLRAAKPCLKLTTDFIVGFPGESEEDFQQTLSLVDEVGFHSAYCFKYSRREGTEAESLYADLPVAIKEKRLAQLLKKVNSARMSCAL